MTAEERAAYINSQAACMLAELAAMQADNAVQGETKQQPRWDAEAFRELPDRYGIGHNSVISYLQDGR